MDVALRPAAMVIPADQLARLDQTACLRDEPRTVTPLEGGLTNVNLKVTTPRGRFVARLSGQTGSLLAIDRLAEYRNSVAAAATGVAPEVLEYQPDAGVLRKHHISFQGTPTTFVFAPVAPRRRMRTRPTTRCLPR